MDVDECRDKNYFLLKIAKHFVTFDNKENKFVR